MNACAKPTPAQLDTMLRAMVLSSEALIARHIEVLGREPNPSQDYEIYDLRNTIADGKKSLKAAIVKAEK